MSAQHETAPTGAAMTARVIAIASGKGGVGKTWLAITLAHVLARGGRRVLLLDGDLGLANVDIQLGLMPRHDVLAVVSGRLGLHEAVSRHPEGGFDILAGRSGSGSLASLQPHWLDRLMAEIDAVRDRYDAILLDLGAGVEWPVRRLTAHADTVMVVATGEPTSLTDAYAVLKLLAADREGADSRILVNQAPSRMAGERTYDTLARACTNFLGQAPALAGIVRRDDHVRRAIGRQALLLVRHPASPAAADVQCVADTLLAAGRAHQIANA